MNPCWRRTRQRLQPPRDPPARTTITPASSLVLDPVNAAHQQRPYASVTKRLVHLSPRAPAHRPGRLVTVAS